MKLPVLFYALGILLVAACSGGDDAPPLDASPPEISVVTYAEQLEQAVEQLDARLFAAVERPPALPDAAVEEECRASDAYVSTELQFEERTDAALEFVTAVGATAPPRDLQNDHLGLMSAARADWQYWSDVQGWALGISADERCGHPSFTSGPDVEEMHARLVAALWHLRVGLRALGANVELDAHLRGR